MSGGEDLASELAAVNEAVLGGIPGAGGTFDPPDEHRPDEDVNAADGGEDLADLHELTLSAAAELSAAGIKCPTCPMCGGAPWLTLAAVWPSQAWCANTDCRAVTWSPGNSPTENLNGGHEVQLQHDEGNGDT